LFGLIINLLEKKDTFLKRRRDIEKRFLSYKHKEGGGYPEKNNLPPEK